VAATVGMSKLYILIIIVCLIAESSRRPGLRSANTADYIKRRMRTFLQSYWSSCVELSI